jgi:hypothetical protein
MLYLIFQRVISPPPPFEGLKYSRGEPEEWNEFIKLPKGVSEKIKKIMFSHWESSSSKLSWAKSKDTYFGNRNSS